MRDTSQKTIWSKSEKLGKDTKASYDSNKKIITFCFNKTPRTLSDDLLAIYKSTFLKQHYAQRSPYRQSRGKAGLRIHPGTQPGQILRVGGRGMPIMGGYRRGDLRVRANVRVPEKLSTATQFFGILVLVFRAVYSCAPKAAEALLRLIIHYSQSENREEDQTNERAFCIAIGSRFS